MRYNPTCVESDGCRYILKQEGEHPLVINWAKSKYCRYK